MNPTNPSPTVDELLTMASTFDVLPYRDKYEEWMRGKPFVQKVMVTRTNKPDMPETWAIYKENSSNLNKYGEWEWAPSPSNRDDDFYERCRWPSAIEAIQFAREHLSKYPTGYKPEDVKSW